MTKGLSVIVADEISVCQLLRKFSTSKGLDFIAETQTGKDIVTLVKEHRPDLIVLEIEMDGVTGIEAAKQLRNELEYYPEIIFVTRSTDPIHIMTAVNEIGAFYIVKPLQEDRWNIAISKILETRAREDWLNKQLKKSSQLIDIRTSRRTYPIAEETILLVEKELGCKTINIYLTNGKMLTSNNTINQIREQASDLIVESIRGFLVNIRHVAGYRRETQSLDMMLRRFTILFKNSAITAPLGRLQEKDFGERLNGFKSGIVV